MERLFGVLEVGLSTRLVASIGCLLKPELWRERSHLASRDVRLVPHDCAFRGILNRSVHPCALCLLPYLRNGIQRRVHPVPLET